MPDFGIDRGLQRAGLARWSRATRRRSSNSPRIGRPAVFRRAMLPVDYAFHSAQMETVRTALPAQFGELPDHEPEVGADLHGHGHVGGGRRLPGRVLGPQCAAAVLFQRGRMRAGPRGAVLSRNRSSCGAGVGGVRVCASRDCRHSAFAAAEPRRATCAGGRDRHGSTRWGMGSIGKASAGSRGPSPLPAISLSAPPVLGAEVAKRQPGSRAAKARSSIARRAAASRPRSRQSVAGDDQAPSIRLIRDHRIAGASCFPWPDFLNRLAAAWKQTSGDTAVRHHRRRDRRSAPCRSPSRSTCRRSSTIASRFTRWLGINGRDMRPGVCRRSDAAPGSGRGAIAKGEIEVEDYYRAMHESGLEYGPRIRTIRELAAGAGHAVATVEVGAEARAGQLHRACAARRLPANGAGGERGAGKPVHAHGDRALRLYRAAGPGCAAGCVRRRAAEMGLYSRFRSCR